jgi:hypothetical protein
MSGLGRANFNESTFISSIASIANLSLQQAIPKGFADETKFIIL